MEQDILIVDDEKDIRSLVSGILEDEGIKPDRRLMAKVRLRKLTSANPAFSFSISGWVIPNTMA